MSRFEVKVDFEPKKLKAYSKNEARMDISVTSTDNGTYWCECDVMLSPPLSLSHDSELTTGRTRMGILKPSSALKKPVRIYTRPNNFPDNYNVNVIAYFYDEDGAIAERMESRTSITCADEYARSIQDK
jgi:hypothetical protein